MSKSSANAFADLWNVYVFVYVFVYVNVYVFVYVNVYVRDFVRGVRTLLRTFWRVKKRRRTKCKYARKAQTNLA